MLLITERQNRAIFQGNSMNPNEKKHHLNPASTLLSFLRTPLPYFEVISEYFLLDSFSTVLALDMQTSTTDACV